MKKSVLAVAVTALVLSGCAANSSNQQRGAGIGAVVGALAGKATGDNAKSRYVWGAALGALAGAAIGGYMDKQEAEFKEELADTGVEVIREGDNLRLYIPGNITFATGSSAIVGNFYPVLDDVARVLNRYDKTRLLIEGHTDSVGRAEYNQTLSESRANSVATYLAQSQVNSSRLQTVGYGESSPISSNESPAGRSANRRVELRIIPVKQG